MDSENELSYHQVKTRRFVLDNNHKCQIKRKHSSTHVSLAASAILCRKLCRLFQISSGRDGRASKSGRRPIERTGIGLLITAALRSIKENVRERSQTFANSPSNFDCSRRTFAINRKRILRWYAS